MTSHDIAVAAESVVTADSLGGPGRADPRLCSMLAVERMSGAAGAGFALASFSIDLGPAELVAGASVAVETRIDKRTRAVVFASMRVLDGADMVFTATGLFSHRSER